MEISHGTTIHFQISSSIFCYNLCLLMMKRLQQLSLCRRTVVVSCGALNYPLVQRYSIASIQFSCPVKTVDFNSCFWNRVTPTPGPGKRMSHLTLSHITDNKIECVFNTWVLYLFFFKLFRSQQLSCCDP